jgi:hypothetical protein
MNASCIKTMHRSLALTAVDRCLSVSDASDHIALGEQVIRDPRLDWLAVVLLANKHLVAPALWTSLSRRSLCEFIPQDVRNYLAFLHSRNTARAPHGFSTGIRWRHRTE